MADPWGDLSWMADGRCVDADPEVFFADHQGDRHSRLAKAVCATCGVREPCLEYALRDPGLDGVWGGLTARERGALRSGRDIVTRPTVCRERGCDRDDIQGRGLRHRHYKRRWRHGTLPVVVP